MEPVSRVSELLAEIGAGNSEAVPKLIPFVYDELHRLARNYLRNERDGHTLQATALVNEAYIRLAGGKDVNWESRAHFIGVAAQVMRRLLVDHARQRHAGKRGGGEERVDFDENLGVPDRGAQQWLTVDQALDRLARFDARQSRIVELRYFGGLSVPETALVLGISEKTVKRDWAMARAWLRRELEGNSNLGG